MRNYQASTMFASSLTIIYHKFKIKKCHELYAGFIIKVFKYVDNPHQCSKMKVTNFNKLFKFEYSGVKLWIFWYENKLRNNKLHHDYFQLDPNHFLKLLLLLIKVSFVLNKEISYINFHKQINFTRHLY